MPEFGDVTFITEQRTRREALNKLESPGRKLVTVAYEFSGAFSTEGTALGKFTGIVNPDKQHSKEELSDDIDIFLNKFEDQNWQELSTDIIHELVDNSRGDNLDEDILKLTILRIDDYDSAAKNKLQINLFDASADKKNT